MKKLIIPILTLLFAASITGCQKETTQPSNPAQQLATMSATVNDTALRNTILREDGYDIDKVTIRYYFDGVLLSRPISVEDKFPIYSLSKNISNQSAIVEIRSFSTEEKYLQYGDANNLKLRKLKEFETKINAYAVQNNLIILADEGKELPQSYYDYQNQLQQTLGLVPLTPWWTTLYDDIVTYGTSVNVFSPAIPWMNPGLSGNLNWNDRTGSYKRGQLYTIEVLYDRTFFRKHLATFSGWGGSVVSFSSYFGLAGLNNKVSSMKLF